ncbi:MAG: biopolymer transporter Tol [Kiritimatiellia bacterium]|jgi:hypothetical protein
MDSIHVSNAAAWGAAVVRPASTVPGRHTFHSYFNLSPESPDGRHVVFFASRERSGERGDLVVLDRRTGEERIAAPGLQTEDAHRGVCQQWVLGSRFVAYHEHVGTHWRVMAWERDGGRRRVLAENWQLGFGTPCANPLVPWVPIYGCHWNPGTHRDFVLVNVETGEFRTVCTLEAATAAAPADWLHRTFGPDGPSSVFFPVLSHDGRRAFFKLSRGMGGDDWRGWRVSIREGKVVVDLETGRPLRFFEQWGHPSWRPDGGGILEKGNLVQDVATGAVSHLAAIPTDHPSFSPDGRLFTSDGKEDKETFEQTGIRVVTVADATDPATATSARVFRGVDTRGATSWRRSHLHPVFSPDSRRIYFNVNAGDWTQLAAAELPL